MNVARTRPISPKSRTLRLSLENVEARLLLCADSAAHAVLSELQHPGYEVVAKYDDDGDQHLSAAQYEALSQAERLQVDPHMIDDSRFNGPVDWDKFLGLPSGGSPDAVMLPDFFPQLDSAVSIDQTTQPGRTLARFGTQVNNQGDGPAILISGNPGDPIPTGAPITSWVNPDGSQNVLQALYDYNGSTFSLSSYREGGRFTYHTGHGHFHFDGYAYYRLRHSVSGQPGGYVVRQDGTRVDGEKTGFCLINTSSSFVMENGQSSTTIPTYNKPGQPSTGCGLLQGVHVGKADEYSSGLSGQWIDVTGVPNGSYFLEIYLDSENAILESNENNNAKSFAFTLNANPPSGGISPDVFDTGGVNNNTFDTAADMDELGVFTQTGLTIHWGLDYDYFRFSATSTGNYGITLTPASGDVNLYVYNANRTLLGSSTNSSGTETVTTSFVKGATYYVKAESYNSSTSSNYQIAWNIKPEVNSAVQGNTTITEGARRRGIFEIHRNGPTSNPLTVNFTLTGTAVRGTDYYNVPLSITIGNLANVGLVEILPIPDRTIEGPESVILTITSNNAYVVGTTGSTLFITDLPTGRIDFPNVDAGRMFVGGEVDSKLNSLVNRSTDGRRSSIFDRTEKEYQESVELLFSR